MKTLEELSIESSEMNKKNYGEVLSETAYKILKKNKEYFTFHLEERIRDILYENKGQDNDIKIPIIDKYLTSKISSEIKDTLSLQTFNNENYESEIFAMIENELIAELTEAGYEVSKNSHSSNNKEIIISKRSAKLKLFDLFIDNIKLIGLYGYSYYFFKSSFMDNRLILFRVLSVLSKFKLVRVSISLPIIILIIYDIYKIFENIHKQRFSMIKLFIKELVLIIICIIISIVLLAKLLR